MLFYALQEFNFKVEHSRRWDWKLCWNFRTSASMNLEHFEPFWLLQIRRAFFVALLDRHSVCRLKLWFRNGIVEQSCWPIKAAIGPERDIATGFCSIVRFAYAFTFLLWARCSFYAFRIDVSRQYYSIPFARFWEKAKECAFWYSGFRELMHFVFIDCHAK